MHCKRMKDFFSKKWHPQTNKIEYETAFAVTKWNGLKEEEKKLHTVSECMMCHTMHYDLQCTCPAQPVYKQAETIASATTNKDAFIKTVIASADRLCVPHFVPTFIETLIKTKKVDKHTNKVENRRKKRELLRQCRDECNDVLQKTTAQVLIKENKSVASYSRKRKATYFETTTDVKKKKTTHSPNFYFVEWDKEQILKDLRDAQQKGQKLVWSKFAKDHQVPGLNRGQAVKEFAIQNGIDVTSLDTHT